MNERPDEPTAESLERIARHLDGQAVPLSEAEARLAEQVRRDEAALAGRLDAGAADAALLRAGARLDTALRRQRRRRMALPAAIAACLAIALTLWIAWPRLHVTRVPTQVALQQAQLAVQRELVMDELASLDEDLLLVAELALASPDELELETLQYEDEADGNGSPVY